MYIKFSSPCTFHIQSYKIRLRFEVQISTKICFRNFKHLRLFSQFIYTSHLLLFVFITWFVLIPAHSFVKSCKQKLIARKDDTDEFIKQLGECLYTIQSFYSNTNWVEMNGGVAYEDFGKYEHIDEFDCRNKKLAKSQ